METVENKNKRLAALREWHKNRPQAKAISQLYPGFKQGVTPAHIDELPHQTFFVFGSNVAGIHGKGAAKTAVLKYGAQWGVGEGFTGRCYAIPTKDKNLKPRKLEDIAKSVKTFMMAASVYPQRRLWVTAIGCGLAQFKPDEIAPMFYAHGPIPKNVWLPKEFQLNPEW
jgi:hypothetical protein